MRKYPSTVLFGNIVFFLLSLKFYLWYREFIDHNHMSIILGLIVLFQGRIVVLKSKILGHIVLLKRTVLDHIVLLKHTILCHIVRFQYHFLLFLSTILG